MNEIEHIKKLVLQSRVDFNCAFICVVRNGVCKSAKITPEMIRSVIDKQKYLGQEVEILLREVGRQ